MADHAGQKMTGSASPVVVSSASSTSNGPLPSPGASRRNSPSDQNATQPDPPMSTQLAHPPPAPTPNAPTAPTAPAAPATPLIPATPASSGAAAAPGQHSNAAAQMYPSVQTVQSQMPSLTLAQTHLAPINGFALPSMQPQQVQRQGAVFPSPRVNETQLCNSSQYVALAHLIQRTEPQVLRQVIRDYHEACLLGSEYHLAFIFNTAIHKAQRSTLTQMIAEFGPRLVQASKRQLLSHFTADDLDELADEIMSKASPNFLDRALARRLETIRARSLVNALAKAERLGYDVKDVVEERKDGTEHVIPYLKTMDRVGKEICTHCGCNFNSWGALSHHMKTQVCGKYTEKDASVLIPALRKFYAEHVSAGASGATREPQSTPSSTQDQSRIRPAQLSSPAARFKAVNSSTAATMTPRTASAAGKNSDPYAHLSPEDRKRLEAELAHTESHYGALLRRAMLLPQPEQDEETTKIKNCFNTKQSTTRRKYGVKLRERRTKAEIEAERERLITAPPEENLAQRQEASASQNGSVPAGKKSRINERGDSAPTSQPAISSPADDSPRKRVRLADMGGLGASAATAEHIDPTTTTAQDHSTPQPQSAKESTSNVAKATPDAPVAATGACNDPMQLDDSTDTEDTDSDSEEEDGDIPAVLTE
ncbi:hypothetical protein MAC_03097 [Metarhizium acridum CQMa 102]|uniref:Uncharacterized protein n=1 Tax=Metarhizium acridum (strain CQMa 102) TaxID=655827 RepID=E9DZP9_METAQ|nr:uncharacterized protein MAC_03097 [Metarhizium acridum CQMa 102]EFY90981.1 hypothetical protein MAC_03097 [Metarhizium acridum CQMa 102]